MDAGTILFVGGTTIICSPLIGYACFASFRAGVSDGRTQGYDASFLTRTLHPFRFFYERGYKNGAEERDFERSIEDMRKNILGY